MKLINISTNQIIAEDIEEAYRFWPRFKGLMMTAGLAEEAGLHLAPCSSIHTFFMNYEIDVLYLNKQKKIVGIEKKLRPGKLGKRFSNAHSVIELHAGKIVSTSIELGQTVAFVDSSKEQIG